MGNNVIKHSVVGDYKFIIPKYKWIVRIPANGEFCIQYTELKWWPRLWMKFIGWKVERVDE